MNKDIEEIKKNINDKLLFMNSCYRTIISYNAPIERKEIEMKEKIEKMKNETASDIEKNKKRIQKMAKEIKKIAKQHKEFLIKEEGKKTIEMASGSISFRVDPAKVKIQNKDEVIKVLKDAGLVGLIRTIEEVNKEHTIELALRGPENVKEEIKNIEGLSITQREELVIEPGLADKPIISQIKKWPVIS